MSTQSRSRARERARGQVLVIFVGGFLALIAGTAFVVDGGNVMAQQRSTQNGVDAASQAGATVISQYLMGGSPATGAIGTCPTASADPGTSRSARPSTDRRCKQRRDHRGRESTSTSRVTRSPTARPRGSSGRGTCRRGQGVHAFASREFDTYFAGAVGIRKFTATTQATAVTNALASLCVPGSPCGLFPITVPFEVSTCDNNGMLHPGQR